MKCTVCQHPQRQDLDCALLAENATYSALSQQYGPSISAIYRHKKHLREKMRQTEKRLQGNLLQGCLFQFNEFLETTRHLNRTAVAADDARRALQAIREGTRILNFITKLDVKLDQDTVYRILANPQWSSQDSLLPTDPRVITDTHRTLADNLFFPCPEPEPDLDDAADDHDAVAADDAVEEEELPAPSPADQSLALLQELFPNLIPPQPKTENRPVNQREKTAKLARKNSPFLNINKEYQKDKQCEKNTRKKPCGGRESEAPPAVRPSCSLSVESPPPASRNRKPETNCSEPETSRHESLFERLRRKFAKIAPSSTYSCDSEEFYEEYLKEKAAAGVPDTPPADQEPESAAPPPATANPQLETPQSVTPKAREPLNPFTHPLEYNFALEHGYRIEDTPKHKPDRRWEEDFGNPRKFNGCY